MVFSSVIFIFYFLPALMLLYFIVPKRFRGVRNIVLLAFSLLFYAYGEPKYILVMLASILINYIFGAMASGRNVFRKLSVPLAATANLGILVYFKYLGFILDNLNFLFSSSLSLGEIVMPIGISFFTFQGLSYVIDVYRGDAQMQKNPLNVALYISLFPQLIAGPIVRYETVAEEIGCRRETAQEAAEGFCRFAFGLGKKIVLANATGFIADTVFSITPSDMSTGLAWLGAIAYSLQIYFDFSGYSDMAIGLGKVFGFHFLENFDFPYISRSITEFWRRWHMSLGSWFRDYVYIPLGGNRVSIAKHVRNILIVWLLTGIWHGAAWNFLVWGLYFGIILLLEKFLLLKVLRNLPRFIEHIYALLLIVFGWVLFRAPDIGYAIEYIRVMFGISGSGLWDGQLIHLITQYRAELILATVLALPVTRFAKACAEKIKFKPLREFFLYPIRGVLAAAVFALAVVYLINSTFNPFIYFRF